MHLSSLLSAVTATLLATSLPAVQACANHGNMTASEQLEIGDDGPAEPATLGFNVNHFALNVYNLEAAMEFCKSK